VNSQVKTYAVDDEVTSRVHKGRANDTVNLLVTELPGRDLPARFKKYVSGERLTLINGYQLDNVPVQLVSKISADESTNHVHFNRPARKHDALSTYSAQANAVDPSHSINQQLFSYTGYGVRVAILDSGFSSYTKQDLADSRISFVSFVDGNQSRHDGDGHGTHVAGIIGGTGAGSARYAGIAPGVKIVSLKVLDDKGAGTIGNIIAGLSWIANHPEYNIRVVNMSVGASVHESYLTDPLTLATKVLVDRGITVVAAAGNRGKNADGQLQWGGIVSPGNAPWVLTVCAFSTQGTYNTSDDAMAGFSSSGPSAVDFGAKPDICAPGAGIVSLTDYGSTLYRSGFLSTQTTMVGGIFVTIFSQGP
jgi:serine protease AprX